VPISLRKVTIGGWSVKDRAINYAIMRARNFAHNWARRIAYNSASYAQFVFSCLGLEPVY